MNKITRLIPIIIATTLFVGCINDNATTSSPVAPFTTSECNAFKGANNLTDAFLDSTINASCSTTITETPCEFIVNNYVDNTDSTITTECPNGTMVTVTRNITVVVDGSSSSTTDSSSSVVGSSSSSVDPQSSTTGSSTTAVSSSVAIQSSSSIATPLINVMQLPVTERSVYRFTTPMPAIKVHAVNATHDTVSFNTPNKDVSPLWSWDKMVDTNTVNVQYKFNAPVDIANYTKLSFTAHGEDTVNVCILESDYGVWKGYWSVNAYGDSTEIGAITGGVCFRAKLNATDSVYTFDLTKQMTVAENLSRNLENSTTFVSRYQGINNTTMGLYWDYVKHHTFAIEVRSAIQLTNAYQLVDETYTKQTVTNVTLH